MRPSSEDSKLSKNKVSENLQSKDGTLASSENLQSKDSTLASSENLQSKDGTLASSENLQSKDGTLASSENLQSKDLTSKKLESKNDMDSVLKLSSKFITFPEYELFCIKNGIKPKDRSETGPFIEIFPGTFSPTSKEGYEKSKEEDHCFYDEIFNLLCKDDENVISLTKIEEFSRKVGCNSSKLTGLLFEIFRNDKITKDEFYKKIFRLN